MVFAMKKTVLKHIIIIFFTVFVFLPGKGSARIPEPGNILYGLLPVANSMISLQINGEVICLYTLGDIPAAGQNFVLRVPIDTIDPQEAGTARPGDEALLFVDAETTAVATVTIGERGTVQRIFLPGTPVDTDNDGYEDGDDNCPGIANADQNDANNNGIGDACDSASDTDGDGYSDQLEYEYYNSGRFDLDGLSAYDPLVKNTPGDEGYVAPDKSSFWLLMLPVILNGGQNQQ
jgi:uncharacterized membrane protein